MPTVKPLPDGRLVELPDDLTEGQLKWLDQNVFTTPQIEPEESDFSFKESFQEVVKGVPRGFASGFLSSAEGLISLFDRGNDSPIIDSLQEAKRALRQDSFLAPDKGMEDAWSTKIGEGLGSFLTFATPTAGVRVLGLAGKGAELGALGAGFGLAGTSGVSQQADFIRASKAKGIDVPTGTEVLGEIAGLGIGLTEMLPLLNVFKYVPMGKGKELFDWAGDDLVSRLKRYGATGVAEAIQETTAGVLQEATAKGLYDPNIKIGQSAYDDAVVGGTVGVLGNVLFDALIPGRQRNLGDLNHTEDKAQKQQSKQNLINQAADKLDFRIVPTIGVRGKPIANTFNIVEKNTGVVELQNLKGRNLAEIQLERLNNNKNESLLMKTLQENVDEQGRFSDSTSQTAILQANSDHSRNVPHSVLLSTLYPNEKNRQTPQQNWVKTVNKKVKGKGKKANEKRASLINKRQFNPEELLNDKIISKKEYNSIIGQKADVIANRLGVKLGTSAQALNKAFKDKNIDEKVGPSISGSTNLQSYFFNLTGKRFWKQMSPEQKRYVLGRVQQLPKSSIKRKMVDVTPRQYTKAQFNNVIRIQDELFARNQNNQGFTRKQISAMATGKGKPLTKEAENQLINRLIDSGRVTKQKGKFVFFKDRGKKNAIENEQQYKKSIAMNAQSYYETPAEFRARLSQLRDANGNQVLNRREIAQIVKNDNARKEKLIDLGQANILQENTLYSKLGDRALMPIDIRTRLTESGLSAPVGATQTKLNNQNRIATTVKKYLESKGLKDVSVLSGSIFLNPSTTTVSNIGSANAAYVSATKQMLFNYEQIINSFKPNERKDLSKISDKVLMNRIGQTVNHETLHALKDMGFFTPEEYNNLKRFVQNTVTKDKRFKDKIIVNGKEILNPTYLQVAQANYSELSLEGQFEEAIAEAFGDFTVNSKGFSGKPKNILQSILDFLTGMFIGFNSSGLQPLEIFELIDSGNYKIDERIIEARNNLKDEEIEEIKYQSLPLSNKEKTFLNAVKALRVSAIQQGQSESRNNFIELISKAALDPDINLVKLMQRDADVRDSVNDFRPYIEQNRQNEISYQKVVNANEFALLDNGMPYSEAGNEFQLAFDELTPEQLDNLPIEEYNKIAEKIREITGEKNFSFNKNYNDDKAFRTYGELKDLIQQSIDSGIDMDWYLKIGQEAEAIVGQENMLEFSVLWAITSASTDPETNFRNAIQIMALARGIDPETGTKINNSVYEDVNAFKKNIRNRRGKKAIAESGVQFTDSIPTASNRTVDEIVKFYEDGKWSPDSQVAIKTPIYGLTTMMLKDGEFMPFMVADRWMYRVMGLTDAIAKRKPSRSEMTYAQWMVKELSNELYDFDGQQYSLDPSNIQALLWFGIRNNSQQESKTEGTVESVLTDAKDLIGAIDYAKQNNNWNDEGSFVNKNNYDLNPSELIMFEGRGNYGTSQIPRILEYQKQIAPKLLVEVNPGIARGYGVLKDSNNNEIQLTQEEAIDLTDRVIKSISDSNGKIKILKDLGIAHNVTRSYGGYNGVTSPNFVIDLLGQRADSQLVHDVAATLGDALMQDAVVTSQPDYDAGNILNIMISKEGSFTADEIQLINDAINEDGGIPNYYNPEQRDPHGLTAKYVGNNILIADEMFLDFDRFQNESDAVKIERYGQFVTYIKDKLAQIDGLPKLEYGAVKTKGEYIDGYQGAVEGIGYKRSAKESPNLQLSTLNNLYIPAWQAFKGFLAEKELTAENNTAPYESVETTALSKAITPNEIKMQKVKNTLQGINDDVASGEMPIFNLENTSAIAQEAAYDAITNPDQLDMNPSGIEDEIKFSKSNAVGTDGFLDKLYKTDDTKLSPFQQAFKSLVGLTSNLREQFIDSLAPIEKSSVMYADQQEISVRASTNAIGAARLGERMKGLMQQALTRGGVIYYTTGSALEGGTKVIQKTFADRNGRLQNVNLLKAFANIRTKKDENLFGQYGVAKRIQGLTSEERKNNIFLKRLKDENLAFYNTLMKEDGVDLFIDSIEKNNPKIVDAYEQFQQWNNSVIEYARDAGVLNDTTAEAWINHSFYFPFYREFENISDSVVGFFGEDINNKQYHQNRPTITKINDSVITRELDEQAPLKNFEAPFSAILRNSLAIMQLSAKNITRQRLANEQRSLGMGVDIPPKMLKQIDQEQYNNIFMYKVNGEKKYMMVEDPTLIAAIESYGADQTLTGFLKFVGIPSNILRELVTRDPGFMAVNLMRDTLSVYATSGANFTPIVDSIKGWASSLDEINQFGLVAGYDFKDDKIGVVDFVNNEFKKMDRDLDSGGKKLANFFNPKGIWDTLGGWTTRSDAATRQAVYKKVLEATGDEFEAAYQALEVINFNRRGNSPVARVVTTAIPFLNARIQGLDVLYRATATNINSLRGKGLGIRRYGAMQSLQGNYPDVSKIPEEDYANRLISRSFFARMGLLSALSALYWLMVSDDEEYKNLKREVRDDNFVIPITKNYAFKYPIAFEVGVITKVIPERMMDLMFGDATLQQTRESLMRQATQTLKIDPFNWQVVAPLYEAFNNKNKFTGRPIVGYYQEGLDPSAQYEDYTNELSRQIGNVIGMSPMKVDHILKGYLGTLGGYGLMVTDKVARGITGRNQSPFGMDQAPVVRRLFMDQRTSRGLQQQYYELKNAVDEVINTERNLRKNKRDFEQAKVFRYNNQDIWTIRNEMNAITRYMTRFRKKRNRILTDTTLSYDERIERIRQLEADRDRRLMVIPLLRERANFGAFD